MEIMSSSDAQPINLHMLKTITEDFSEKMKVGSGAYGAVYKGVLNGAEIAVKKLFPVHGIDEKAFENEFLNLKKFQHKNVLGMFGYCYEIVHRHLEYEGKLVWSEVIDRALCFEYMKGGSLANHISAESCMHDWPTTYKLINGTCEGLHHLHKGGEMMIFHLDLKLENVLLDEHLVPKIGDFGLSRLFGTSYTHEIATMRGTVGFAPPEYIQHRKVPPKNDVFSLGVIIFHMMAGAKGYGDYWDARHLQNFSQKTQQDFIESVQEYWKTKMQASKGYRWDETDLLGVAKCIEMAMRCVEDDRDRRPSITEILGELKELDSKMEEMLKEDPKPLIGHLFHQGITEGSRMYDTEPRSMTLQELHHMTDGFSEKRLLGMGGYGMVYKGVLVSGEVIAVKKLNSQPGLVEDSFKNELLNLMRVQHQNIIRLVGYCSETRDMVVEYQGQFVVVCEQERALCLEYMEGGTLEELLSEENTGLSWHTRYRIIRGICEGLKYLHDGLEYPIMHFNLNPGNILLDKSMVPKITDFGLSKLFGEENTKRTMTLAGTSGYWPPEYIKHQIISREFDIFSLGVIIVKVMTGREGYNHVAGITSRKFVKKVHENWRKRLRETLSHTSLEVYCNQVKRCIEIALDCLISNRQERPSIQEILSVLNETEAIIGDRGMQNEQALQFVKIALSADTNPVDHSLFSRSSRENKAHRDPNNLPYQLIKKITNDFDKDRILGSGGFGTVYKGVHENQEEVAIKVLHNITGLDDSEFRREFDNLKRLKHQNVVKLVGFCSEEEEELVEYQGKNVPAMHIRLALCFEYVDNGSLEKYISDEQKGFDWHTRYKIINGICEGLKYLHENLIMHCDLKPGNILLDKYNRPKIADFGLSKLFGEENTKKTMSSIGTCGYRPPEFIDRQIISREFDIYSLGVIIVKIMTGHEGYTSGVGTLTPNSVNLVHGSWMKRLRETTNQKLYGSQVKRCIGIAIDCLKTNRCERPTIGEIVSRLNKQYGASTHPSRIATITIDSGTSSEGHSEATMATHTENLWDVAPQHGLYLDRYISDISSGFDWQTRYSIIKSICEHLKYLHDGLKTPIIHMNLKTSNILLDENMIPGLGDFGMPRLTGEENDMKTTSMMGTIEHMPPEFIEKQVISKEFDIYSLGVIILKVMTGERLYSKLFNMSPMDFIELAHEEWREGLQKTVNVVSAEVYCEQVKKCLEIAFKCVEPARIKRLAIGDITHMLNQTETWIPLEQIDLEPKDPELPTEAAHSLELLIEVQPQELCFQFMSSFKLSKKKDISCLLHLNNRGNDRVAFMLVANNFKRFLTKKPICGMVPHRSTYTLNLTMLKQTQSSHEDNFFTLYTVAVGGYDLRDVDKGSLANEYDKYFKKARETAVQEVQEMILKVLCCQDADGQGTSSSEPTLPTVEIITTPDARQVSSIDVHPEEPWIMTTNNVGSLGVWDYHRQ